MRGLDSLGSWSGKDEFEWMLGDLGVTAMRGKWNFIYGSPSRDRRFLVIVTFVTSRVLVNVWVERRAN